MMGGRPNDSPSLTPRNGRLYVVRWLRTDGSCVKHRYFRRRADALAFLERLRSGGWSTALFVAHTSWRDVSP